MVKKKLNIEETFSLALENHKKNNFSSAEKIYSKILKINSKHFNSIFYLASLYAQTKNFYAAQELFEKAIKIRPDYALAYSNLGAVLKELGNFEESINVCQKAIKIDPKYSAAYSNLGAALRETGRFKDSVNACEKALKVQPNNFGALHNLALSLQELNEIKKAMNCYKILSKIQSNPGNAYQNLGKLSTMIGEKKEAINFYQLAIEHEPENLFYYYNLSYLDENILDENLKIKINHIIKKNSEKNQNTAYAHFLLSKYELNLKNYQKELDHLINGHNHYFESKKKQYTNDVDYWLNQLPKNEELNNQINVIKKAKTSSDKLIPIFIIGVPRCGSTLIEKIIASGSHFVTIGEETGILSVFVKKKIIRKKSIYNDFEKNRNELIEKYGQRNLLQEKSNYIFTDKTLDNFFYIDLIKGTFPNAKVINCVRDPLLSIMSIIKNNLPSVSWSHNIEHIFKYFDIYYKKIKNFNKIFPNYIYELDLEKFSNEPIEESKKLMKFCNLPWDIKCLEFYKRKDLISKTTSNVTLRQKIYKQSSEKYLPYKNLLKKYGDKYSWFK